VYNVLQMRSGWDSASMKAITTVAVARKAQKTRWEIRGWGKLRAAAKMAIRSLLAAFVPSQYWTGASN
jgi:hypothetical protein